MRKHACSLLLSAAVLVTACNKQDLQPAPDSALQEAIAKVDTWLEDQRAAGDEDKNIRIQQIKGKLDYNRLRLEELREGERFIIVPLKEGLATINNPGKHPESVLLLIESKAGTIRRGNIVQYIPDQPQADAAIPVNSFSKIFNAEKPGKDAQFCFLTITGRLLYQVKYKDGVLQSDGVTRPGSTIVNGPPQDPIGPAPTCTDWYLVTTYYYADGSTDQTEEYLYTTCEPGAGGGGGQGNDMEYEFEAYRLVEWPIYIFPGNIYKIVSYENIRGRRVAGEPQGGHFKSASHHGDVCNNPDGVWAADDWDVSATGQNASSYVEGVFNPDNGTNQYISNSRSWLFKDLFPPRP